MGQPTKDSLDKMWKFVKGFAEKSGTTFHPNPAVTEAVVNGLATHVDELVKPLCPCNFYLDKQAEARLRRWHKAPHHASSSAQPDDARVTAASNRAPKP